MNHYIRKCQGAIHLLAYVVYEVLNHCLPFRWTESSIIKVSFGVCIFCEPHIVYVSSINPREETYVSGAKYLDINVEIPEFGSWTIGNLCVVGQFCQCCLLVVVPKAKSPTPIPYWNEGRDGWTFETWFISLSQEIRPLEWGIWVCTVVDQHYSPRMQRQRHGRVKLSLSSTYRYQSRLRGNIHTHTKTLQLA